MSQPKSKVCPDSFSNLADEGGDFEKDGDFNFSRRGTKYNRPAEFDDSLGYDEDLVVEHSLELFDDNKAGLQTHTKGQMAKRTTRKSLIFNFNQKLDDTRFEAKIVEEEWSFSHVKLLYLISKYAVCSTSVDQEESWIRSVPLSVLIYECITAGILDFDYAPKSVMVSQGGITKRLWMHISQEGKCALDDLREKGLVNGLKLSTEDFHPVTALQVSIKGMVFLEQVSDDLRGSVDSCIHTPPPFSRELLLVEFRTDLADNQKSTHSDEEDEEDDDDDDIFGKFFLVAQGVKYERQSTITSSEDVSYVSSPYLPSVVRNMNSTEPFTNNRKRRHESASGDNNIMDEIDEAITLSEVYALVAEWIPFGSNQIVALNERLGALDRCQGGLFTAMVDRNPNETKFQVPPGLTQVKILDYDLVRFINFEAEINYPEADGIVQIENFGMHLNVDGTIIYGIKIEAIMDRTSESISVDHLSRLLVDIHQDSSEIMNDLLSSFQRSLLDLIFQGDTDNRGKFNMIIANGITPLLSAKDYLDKGDYENELKQVLGDIHETHDIGDTGLLIIGREGILVAGDGMKDHEKLLTTYLSLLCKEMFIRNFFVRTFVLDSQLKTVRRLILEYTKDPTYIEKIRLELNSASRNIILLKEVLEYLKESLVSMQIPEEPTDNQTKLDLFKLLKLKEVRHDVTLRVEDLEKLVEGANHELSNLQQMSDVINKKQLENVFKNVEANTKHLVDASAANERSSASLEVMQVILAGGFAFDIVDRISGGTLNITVPDWVNIYLVDKIISVPFLWFFINMLWLFGVSVCLFKLMRTLSAQANGALTVRVKLDCRVNLKNLDRYLGTLFIEAMDTVMDENSTTIKCSWKEIDVKYWEGEAPKLEMQCDYKNGFLLLALIHINRRRNKLSQQQLIKKFLIKLKSVEVIDEINEEQVQSNTY